MTDIGPDGKRRRAKSTEPPDEDEGTLPLPGVPATHPRARCPYYGGLRGFGRCGLCK